MAARNFANKLINKSDINEEIRKIKGTKCDYISENGNVYKDMGNNMFYKKSTFINKHNGYKYVSLQDENGKQYQRRVHILVAEEFLPNPYNLPIVLHKNNDKTDPVLSNLKWGTVSENTKSAFDDGLAYNDAGYNDSQSIEIAVFDLNFNLIFCFRSISQAAKELGLTKTGILYQCNHLLKTKPICGYYFRYLEEYEWYGFVL